MATSPSQPPRLTIPDYDLGNTSVQLYECLMPKKTVEHIWKLLTEEFHMVNDVMHRTSFDALLHEKDQGRNWVLFGENIAFLGGNPKVQISIFCVIDKDEGGKTWWFWYEDEIDEIIDPLRAKNLMTFPDNYPEGKHLTRVYNDFLTTHAIVLASRLIPEGVAANAAKWRRDTKDPS